MAHSLISLLLSFPSAVLGKVSVSMTGPRSFLKSTLTWPLTKLFSSSGVTCMIADADFQIASSIEISNFLALVNSVKSHVLYHQPSSENMISTKLHTFLCSALRTTAAEKSSCTFGSGNPNTMHSATPGWAWRISSNSAGLTWLFMYLEYVSKVRVLCEFKMKELCNG